MQENLKSLSSRSERIIAKGSGHDVQIDRVDLIEREVPLFIEQIRGTAPTEFGYGTTVTKCGGRLQNGEAVQLAAHSSELNREADSGTANRSMRSGRRIDRHRACTHHLDEDHSI